MIVFDAIVRIAAPVVWRNDAEIAKKLEEFSATEAGSALDMLKAAELETIPRLRRLFFRHAMDEARHARQFEAMARATKPREGKAVSEYTPIHARRQNLFDGLGRARFLAFVHLAEKDGEQHFRSLARHFEDRPELAELFATLAEEERFHVRYSIQNLLRVEGASASRSLRRVRLDSAWAAWRRQGRAIGDRVARLTLALLYLIVLPIFALAQKKLEPEKSGWKKAPSTTVSRRQF